jgi:hypothetical protein
LRNTGNVLPNPDAIGELRVETNNYSAEYGRFGNGVVNAVTKSGTNQFHGSAFEFVRNTAFDANAWNALSKPPLIAINLEARSVGLLFATRRSSSAPTRDCGRTPRNF